MQFHRLLSLIPSLNKEWIKGEVNGTTYGMSNKGWTDSELFRGWLTGHFLQLSVAACPLLLILNGHSSHYQPELVQYAKEKDVILFCLPPHTKHESQPLDISVFKPLKQNWQVHTSSCSHTLERSSQSINFLGS